MVKLFTPKNLLGGRGMPPNPLETKAVYFTPPSIMFWITPCTVTSYNTTILG